MNEYSLTMSEELLPETFYEVAPKEKEPTKKQKKIANFLARPGRIFINGEEISKSKLRLRVANITVQGKSFYLDNYLLVTRALMRDHKRKGRITGENKIKKKTKQEKWYFVDSKLLTSSPSALPDGIKIIQESRNRNYVICEGIKSQVVTYDARHARIRRQHRLNAKAALIEGSPEGSLIDAERVLLQNSPEGLPPENQLTIEEISSLEALLKRHLDGFILDDQETELLQHYLKSDLSKMIQEETSPSDLTTLEEEFLFLSSQGGGYSSRLFSPKFLTRKDIENNDSQIHRFKK